MQDELLRRAEDLQTRCARTYAVTATAFLTPAEQRMLSDWAARRADCALLLHGGGENCERRAAFFLPEDLEAADFDPAEYLRAVRVTAHFGEPGHRDYLGAALGLGIRREWLGDVRIFGQTAYFFCLPSVERALLELEQVGRVTVKTAAVALADVPQCVRRTKRVTFTVMTLRLDAAAAGLFGLSRAQAAAHIRAGDVSLDYAPCIHTDAPVRAGDILSLRGVGKGEIAEVGGLSRKGRLFITAELWL